MPVSVAQYVRARVNAWRSGSVRAQWTAAAIVSVLIGVSFLVSLVNRGWMPLPAYFLWLLVARILLSFRPLLVVGALDALAGSLSVLLQEDMSAIHWVSILEFLATVLLVVYIAARAHSDLPSTLNEALL